MIHLVLGGARSGKSSFAEQDILQKNRSNNKPCYIATAKAFDLEMQQRIKHHQLLRQEKWQLIECPLHLADLLNTLHLKKSGEFYLIDCLTLWLNNLIFGDITLIERLDERFDNKLYEKLNDKIAQKITELVQALTRLSQSPIHITLVSNEVGLGVIPMGCSSRLFVDNCGRLNQAIAKLAQQVTLITAGIPQTIKGKTN